MKTNSGRTLMPFPSYEIAVVVCVVHVAGAVVDMLWKRSVGGLDVRARVEQEWPAGWVGWSVWTSEPPNERDALLAGWFGRVVDGCGHVGARRRRQNHPTSSFGLLAG